MFNLGLYFSALDLTKTKVLLNLGLKSFSIWSNNYFRIEKKLLSKTQNFIKSQIFLDPVLSLSIKLEFKNTALG